MKKVNLHIKDGKVIAENGKEFVLARLEDLEHLQKQLSEANKLLRYCCANYESSRFGATITEDGEILPKGPVWNYLKKWGVK